MHVDPAVIAKIENGFEKLQVGCIVILNVESYARGLGVCGFCVV